VTKSDLVLPASSDLEALSDPGSRIIVACERAKTWLAQALEGDQIEQIVELKSQAEAMRIYAMQKQLGKDAQLSAAEIVRRAERCIGLAIRKGQKEGRIAKPGQGSSARPPRAKRDRRDKNISLPSQYLEHGQQMTDTYAMTDGVSDEQFEKAIGEAKTERNLSRANVVRKVKGNGKADRWAPLVRLASSGATSHQIAAKLGVSPSTVRKKARELKIEIRADLVVGKATLPNQARILTKFALSLGSLIPTCDMIDPSRIDKKAIKESLSILDESIPALTKLRRKLRREIENGSRTK